MYRNITTTALPSHQEGHNAPRMSNAVEMTPSFDTALGALLGGAIALSSVWLSNRFAVPNYQADRRSKLSVLVSDYLADVQREVEKSQDNDDPLSTRDLMRRVAGQLVDFDRKHLYGMREAGISAHIGFAHTAALEVSGREVKHSDADDWDPRDDELMREFSTAMSGARRALSEYEQPAAWPHLRKVLGRRD